MNLKSVIFFLGFVLIITHHANSQVLVDGQNVNDNNENQYLQLMYSIEKGSTRMSYFIDYGISDRKLSEAQKLMVGGTAINGTMSPVMVLNLLYKNGWEYVGDTYYVREPMVDNWFVFTLKRKSETEAQARGDGGQ